MSTSNKGNKPKSARAQRAEFDRVLQTLESESRAYQTPSSQSKYLAIFKSSFGLLIVVLLLFRIDFCWCCWLGRLSSYLPLRLWNLRNQCEGQCHYLRLRCISCRFDFVSFI